MEHCTKSLVVNHWTDFKQQNETTLATELLRLFNHDSQLIEPIREMVGEAVGEMIRTYEAGERHSVESALQQEGRLKVLRNSDLMGIARSVQSLRAEECGELIRLYGAFVEQVGHPFIDEPVPREQGGRRFLAQQKDAYRKDWPHFTDPAVGGQPQASLIWDKDHGGGRLRKKTAEITDASQRRPRSRVHGEVRSLGGGIQVWTLGPDSTVRKIDRTFGLMEGADISGTTTDALFFIDRFKSLSLDPIYYLLPVATIVAEGHHSLLEVALALTLNRRTTGVDYRIGFYTTLMPQEARHPARRAIETVLRACENNPMNSLMLVYHNAERRTGGCYRFGKGNSAFRLLASADDNLLQTFRRMPPWPSKADVDGLIELYGVRG